MQIEFTDRYGGRPPSWLRGCHGDCEATGYVPVRNGDDAGFPNETDPRLLVLWREAEAREPTDDGWHFVRCPACRGTGRAPWWRTVLRVPRWLWKGVRVIWYTGIVHNKDMRPATWTWRREFVTALTCAFLADLGLWRP